MRMQSCPHCGADNSIRRERCYQCQRPLAPVTPRPQAPERPAAASRWEALEPLREGRRPARGADSSPGPSAPAPTARSPRRSAPVLRQGLTHVRHMTIFFRELHMMLRAGAPAAQACRELSLRAPAGLRPVAREMAEAAAQGERVSGVMQRHRGLFQPWHIGVMRAAEAGGFLPDAIEQIALAYETEWETRSALRLRLFFALFFGLPAILLVLPSIMALREPIPEQGWDIQLMLKTIWSYLARVSLPIGAGVVGLVVIWQALSAFTWFQVLQQRLVVRLPIVGRLARAAALERYTAALGLLLRGGLSPGEAAEEAAMAAGNIELTPVLMQVAPAVREGVPLARALAETRAFDQDTLSLAATGETAGSLPEMLARAAGYYRLENEVRRKTLLRVAGVAIGLIWMCAAGAVFLLGVRTYFDFVFRAAEWMFE